MNIFCNEVTKLGEGPLWHSLRNSLFWLDILNRKLFEKKPGGNTLAADNCWDLPEYASALAMDKYEENILWMVTNKSFGKYNLSKCIYIPVINLKLPETLRANDGGVSPDGSFWFGTMEWSPSGMNGTIYSVSASLTLKAQDIEIGIPNTFCWSPDGRTIYISDSYQQKMFSYEVEDGIIKSQTVQIIVDLSGGNSTPDGGAIDIHGCLWNTHWDGHKVVKYSHDGKTDHKILMPVPRPTSCCFGGPGNEYLFVTSATSLLNAEKLAEYPKSGNVFVRRLTCPGQPVLPFCVDV